MEWVRVFEICEKYGGTEWYIVEQESCAFAPLNCVERYLKNLQQMGK